MKHLRSFFAVLLAAAVCAAVVLFSGCGASVQVQQLTIPGERGSIHATLTTPANAENMPAVVICHGFTGNRQLDGHAKPLAKTLAQHGIASIAIDFAGSGESEEPFTAYTPANMRDDITSAITYLTDTVGADPERIGLLGHSMGGRAVSVYLKDSIKAAALWAPADNTGLDGLEFLDHSAEGRQAFLDEIATHTDGHFRDVELTTDSNIITLSTCIGSADDQRYIVQAVLTEAAPVQG